MPLQIIVVGGGPKALAIALKATALTTQAKYKVNVPNILLIEDKEIGANWCGRFGYTDGDQVLCTPPENDLGFPYSSIYGHEVDRESLRFSWNSYLVESGLYCDWIDRRRPQPSHEEWASYLRWAGKATSLKYEIGRVKKVLPTSRGWQVQAECLSNDVAQNKQRRDFYCDGIVFTGPGRPFNLDHQDIDLKISNGRTFWERIESFRNLPRGSHVCIIGSGETAATIVIYLLGLLGSHVNIDIVNHQGDIETRGEDYDENRHFSDPTEFVQWPPERRKKFLEYADKGVFSPQAKRKLNGARNVKRKAASAKYVKVDRDRLKLGVILLNGVVDNWFYDRVIVAKGFNPMTPVKLFPKDFIIPWSGTWAQRIDATVDRIDWDLSVISVEPKVHLPMLAALNQGPGFPKLNCLGRLSDRILSAYVQP